MAAHSSTAASPQWEVELGHGKWSPFPDVTAAEIERHHQGKNMAFKLALDHDGRGTPLHYHIDLHKMVQKSDKSGRERKIRRVGGEPAATVAEDRPAKKSRLEPFVVTVRNVAGNVVWGPTALEKLLKAKELAELVGGDPWCIERRLIHGETALDDDRLIGPTDSSDMPSPVDLQIAYKPPPAVNHECVKEFLALDTEEASEAEIGELKKKFASRPAYEGISSVDSVSPKLLGKLNHQIDNVKASEKPDYHPGSNNIVRDIVHPSLFPFVKGESVFAEGHAYNTFEEARAEEDGDLWNRKYEDSKYQWLPADVSVDSNGKCCFMSYINNLNREKYSELYASLEELLAECLPHFENCLGYANAVKFVPNGDPDEVEEELMDCDELECPKVEPVTLRDRTLQVIVKIADYEIPAGGTHNGVWHVEGMSHENIVSTSEIILRKDANLAGAELEYKRAFTKDEAGTIRMEVAQCRSEAVEDFIGECLVPLGKKELPCGRLVSWPNSHVHCITPLKNNGKELAIRRLVVFWLVHPERRVVSTFAVLPQQGVMPLEKALQHRLDLMEERKRHKQDWNVREISLCEH